MLYMDWEGMTRERYVISSSSIYCASGVVLDACGMDSIEIRMEGKRMEWSGEE